MRKLRFKDFMTKKRLFVILLVVLVCAGVTYHFFQDAYAAYNTEKPGKSRTYTNGYIKFFVSGPSGTSSMQIKYYCSGLGSDVSQDEFNNKSRKATISVYSGGGGPYNLQLKTSAVSTSKNSSGNYTILKTQIAYTIPAHEYQSSTSVDMPGSSIIANQMNISATSGTISHASSNRTVTRTIDVSGYAAGLSTYNQIRYFNCSRTFQHVRNTYTVSYNGNGGSLSYYSKSFACGTNFQFPNATRTGYNFTGWRRDHNNGDWMDTGWVVCSTNYSAVAQWTPKTYTISYNGNGADSGDVSNNMATYGSNFTLPQNGYWKKGYKFLGWSSDRNAVSAQYSAGQTFPYQTDHAITFYAIWGKSDFEVKFHGNGSSAADYTADLAYNKSVNLPKNIFERPGYTFLGWVKDPTQDTVDYTDGQAVKDLCEPGDTFDLYALWRKSDGSFETKNIIHDDKMFLGDINLIGQNGTGYSNANIDSKSAHIDKEEDPGYFTDRYSVN